MPPISGDQTTAEYVKQLIQENKIFIFSKTSCPWCDKVKALFNSMNEKFASIELDVIENGDQVLKFLIESTQQTTVPSVFVNGAHLGGFDTTSKALNDGRLKKLLDQAKLPTETAEAYTDRLIKSSRILIFSTTTCPWCVKAKELLNAINEEYSSFAFDTVEYGPEMRKYLTDKFKQSSVPNIFISGYHIGGYDNLQKAQKDGRLQSMLYQQVSKSGVSSKLSKRVDQSIDSFVNDLIRDNNVVVFGKTTCPFSAKVRELFKSLGQEHASIDLDQIDDGPQIKDYLYEKTGQKTVPNVFVSGTHLGGSDNTLAAHSEGRLAKLLAKKR
jgi:glutaredoxin